MIRNKQFLSLMVFMFLTPHIICAQKIFSVKYQSESDLKVFVVDYESQADLKVYKLQYMSQAKVMMVYGILQNIKVKQIKKYILLITRVKVI